MLTTHYLQKQRCLGFCKIANAEDETMHHDPKFANLQTLLGSVRKTQKVLIIVANQIQLSALVAESL